MECYSTKSVKSEKRKRIPTVEKRQLTEERLHVRPLWKLPSFFFQLLGGVGPPHEVGRSRVGSEVGLALAASPVSEAGPLVRVRPCRPGCLVQQMDRATSVDPSGSRNQVATGKQNRCDF